MRIMAIELIKGKVYTIKEIKQIKEENQEYKLYSIDLNGFADRYNLDSILSIDSSHKIIDINKENKCITIQMK